MKKTIIALAFALSLSVVAQRNYNMQMDEEGNIVGWGQLKNINDIAGSNWVHGIVFGSGEGVGNGNLAGYGENGLEDTGVSTENFIWQIGYTNVSQILSSVGKPDGIAQLDENGKIDAELIETITVVFTGSHTATNAP